MTRLRDAIDRLKEEEAERIKGHVVLMRKTADRLVGELSTFFEECLDDNVPSASGGGETHKTWTFSSRLTNDGMTIAINFPDYFKKTGEHYNDKDLGVLMTVVRCLFQEEYQEYVVKEVGHSLVIREQPPITPFSWRNILRKFCPVRREE